MDFKVIYLLCSLTTTAAIEPVSGMAVLGAGIAAGLFSVYKPIKCSFTECCTNKWIHLNDTNLLQQLTTKLYGQHLVTSTVVKHLKAHMTKEPSKAMALSFHGGTGTGKNYVSKILAESIYERGMKSKFVHLISATKDFPHEAMVPMYKDKLRDLIESSVRECERSMFIFDEMDKMPPGLIDTIKPYLDYYDHLGGVDYKNSMFIFLSNTAGADISRKVLEIWKAAKPRESIQLVDLETIITTAAINTKNSGMWHSVLLRSHLITAFIPFLPMERIHVRECIKDVLVANGYFKNRFGIGEDYVRKVTDELQFFPPDLQIFSAYGCKRVVEKVDFVLIDSGADL